MDLEKKVLPLKDAYRFAEEHGLERDVGEIKTMKIEWDLSYTSSLRRGYLIELFTTKQLFDAFKERYWPAGNTPWGQRKSAIWLRLKDRYQDFLDGRDYPGRHPAGYHHRVSASSVLQNREPQRSHARAS